MGIREYFDPLSGRPDNDAERERWLRHVDAIAARIRQQDGWRRLFSANPRDRASWRTQPQDPLAERMAMWDQQDGAPQMRPPGYPPSQGPWMRNDPEAEKMQRLREFLDYMERSRQRNYNGGWR